MTDFSTGVTAALLLAGATMTWLGWVLLPSRIGIFFAPGDFAKVHARFRPWIWLFRIHLFGHVVTVMALVAFGTLATEAAVRVVAWPAIAISSAGLLVSALAAAFYYHFGAWGALDMAGKSENDIVNFVGSLRVTTEYVTCLVRFGRVFFGLGQLVLAVALFQFGLGPVGTLGAILGLAAMAVTLGFPDDLDYYMPIFHVNALWLATIGLALLT
ncbi:MAG: hypothetical protein CL471_09965 [Acidobacteria bacterium]|nr:hypothetical protein [Acidobacteriota bacterium]